MINCPDMAPFLLAACPSKKKTSCAEFVMSRQLSFSLKGLFINYFSEISYLQLTTLDLSGNRIATLPVELRFMTTVMCLNLGENPLTCPPANVS